MAKVLYRPEAVQDLEDIWEYIACDNVERADAYLRKLHQSIQLLAENPAMGKKRNEIMEDLKSFPTKSHVIFYIPMEQSIDVVRILHGAQDVENNADMLFQQ